MSFLLISSCSGSLKKQTDERPNIILIVADDAGYSDLSNYGGEISTPIVEKIDAGDGSDTVDYDFDKKPKKWNILIGSQFQINKHWPVRVEGGFLGDRSSLLLSANYRFGIKGGNKLSK